MPAKTKLILNPMADMGRAWRIAERLRPIVVEHGAADWSGTVYPGHAVELARAAGEGGYERVVAVGGDGTVHEVINGLMQVEAARRPLLGIVPVGSGNDFAHALGLPLEPEAALRQALTGAPAPVDLGLLRDERGRLEYFDNTLGIGFDAVVTIRSHSLPVVRGFLMYLTAVIQTIILNFQPMDLTLQTDREQWQQPTLMLAVGNGPREGGGFLVTPEAVMTDGLLHYASICRVSRAMMFRLIPEVMAGRHGRFPQVRMGTCTRMDITSDRPLYIHLDGEVYSGFGSTLRQVHIEVVPAAVQVVRG